MGNNFYNVVCSSQEEVAAVKSFPQMVPFSPGAQRGESEGGKTFTPCLVLGPFLFSSTDDRWLSSRSSWLTRRKGAQLHR